MMIKITIHVMDWLFKFPEILMYTLKVTLKGRSKAFCVHGSNSLAVCDVARGTLHRSELSLYSRISYTSFLQKYASNNIFIKSFYAEKKVSFAIFLRKTPRIQ